ncbi:MAG: GNAT family N-acetyltransferase [Pseudomonas marincola]
MKLTFQLLDTVTAAPLLAALHEQCFDKAWTEKAFTDLLALPSTTAEIIMDGEIPIGFCLYQISFDEAEILTVGIIPSARGLSAGSALLARGFTYLADRDVKRLLLEVSATNSPAIKVYQKCGFSEIGRRKAYYREESGQVDALMFEKFL